ncbi:hypothetical protein [Bacillus altitudinis]|uniref:hypothetical protein n=1 Tax=Bacillus altitudinis TaxID=293387 RepID=UPI001F61968F|nr:hypothetical protein [Bacillus altitudinis]
MVCKKKKQNIIDDYEINKNNDRNFNKRTLKNSLIAKNARVFVGFINYHFPLDGQKIRKYKNKYDALKSLDEHVLINAISRTKALEIIYESKYINTFVGSLITVAVIPLILAVGDYFIAGNPDIENDIKLGVRVAASLFAAFMLWFFPRKIIKDKNVIALLVSFRELLEQALAAKKNKIEND